ncbi:MULTISPECIES: FAD:protein FMN transferase [unclassified Luteococcus]|uniref:FAD:protein FMN transferase n=1 Tax=unclassified Luteococcus TaxID=2639923 RepID=UPI00313ED328
MQLLELLPRQLPVAQSAFHTAHLSTPRTLTPAPLVWRNVTVVAPSATLANVLATASIVRGHHALRWLESQNVAARLMAMDGTVRRIGAWPA